MTQPQSVLASAARTASGQSGLVTLSGEDNLLVTINVTAASGTTPQLDLYVEASDDGGTTFFEYPASLVLKSSGVAAGNTVTANARDIVDAKTSTTAEKFVGIYQNIAFRVFRLAWIISGTTPSFTFTATVQAG